MVEIHSVRNYFNMKLTTSFCSVTRVFCLMMIFISTIAFAQEDVKKTYISTDTVVVIGERIVQLPAANTIATKLPVSLRQTPASVGVVTSALIENQDAVVLSDALRNISGVNPQTGFGAFDYFTIRGFESLTNSLVLIDGAGEPEVTFYNLYNIDRVEVLKGPSAFLYGANPLSGTINLVRKQPVFKNFLHVGSSYGKFKSYRSTVDLGLANLNSSLAFRLNALWQDSENYRDDKANDNLSVNPALTWRVNEKTSLTANFEYVKSNYEPDSGLPLLNNQIPNVPRTQSYQSPFDKSEQKILRARLDFETRLNEAVTLRNKFYYTDLDWQSGGTLLLGAFPSPFGEVVGRTMTILDDRQKLAGNQLEAVFNFRTGSLRHQILTGLELNRLGDEFSLNVGLLPVIGLNSPQETATSVTSFPFMVTDARSVTFAPYLLDQIIFSEKFQTFIGGRYDVTDYEDARTLFTQTGQPFSSPTKREFKKASPMLGLVYSPTPNFSFYTNGGQAFGPPSTQVVGDIKAEESEQVEIGVKTQFFNRKLNTSLAVYNLKKDNLTIPDFSGLLYNTGNQKSRGLEIEMAAEPSRGWQMFAAYAFTEAELTEFQEDILVLTQQGPIPQRVDRSGNTPAFAPKHILNVWTNKEFNQRLGVGVGGRYLSEQFIDEDNQFKIDGIFLVDAMLYYNIGQWRWSINAKNLTDTKYETRGFGSTSVIPGNPFAIYGGVEFRL